MILLILYMVCTFIVSLFAMYCHNKRDINAIYATIIVSVFWPFIFPVVAVIGLFTKRGRKYINKICKTNFD